MHMISALCDTGKEQYRIPDSMVVEVPSFADPKRQETRIVTWDMIPNLRNLDCKVATCNMHFGRPHLH